ncbi:Hypothetical protein NAEGRDRAFT_69845 [Naegleria gruberi]|uniref:F-box domain-containing protein n=1 Tax=Naegleria gruberi TaxID=5762 RepID=D2VLN6_NAEGR|nr:uncharacterized protein NAEGRDRAFT_69845 [Naegleria gruberi]EFC42090.1 Hypothetical protein NAEGRDRAFT_69845 [Naegleria gruberi]|eukprot:XP_002674834.1 Hypothetical protein NAEGRDRAFT_69845 [Naegleria gruberi strain NEG-M]
MQKLDIHILPDEIMEAILSNLQLYEVFFCFSRVSKYFQQLSHSVIQHEYYSTIVDQFNQKPSSFNFGDCIKFVKFSLRNSVYQYAVLIIQKYLSTRSPEFNNIPVIMGEKDLQFWKQSEQDFMYLKAFFDNFHDLPGRGKPVIEPTVVKEEEGLLSNIFSVFETLFAMTSRVIAKKTSTYSDPQQSVHIIGEEESVSSFFNCASYDKTQSLTVSFPDRCWKIAYVGDGKYMRMCLTKNDYNMDQSSYFILVGNPYSSNCLTEFEMMKNGIKQYSKGAEVIVVTSMKDLQNGQPRFISNEQANWFAYQQFGGLFKDITTTELEEPYVVSCYCFLMRYFLGNKPLELENENGYYWKVRSQFIVHDIEIVDRVFRH